MKFVVISAGHAPASGTSRLARLICDVATARVPGLASEVIELRDIAVEVTSTLIAGTPTEPVGQAIDQVRSASALALLTPTVNASFSGLLKSFLDVLPRDALRGVPTLIGATGGTHRHTLVLDQSVRPMLAFLRAVVLPTGLFVTADEWCGSQPSGQLAKRIDQVSDELGCFLALRRTPLGV